MLKRTVISVRGLGKRYQLGETLSTETLRDALAAGARRFFRRSNTDRDRKDVEKNFWALRNVSFDVVEGAVVGIIGHNGAGKSTLLKILSGITEPTEGEARMRGRVGALLEVGTGFHQELSGRENIFMNGAILGMSQAEIRAKFDEIVDFAGIARFIDTPVKRYSSGMLVRLGFAVAAHLEPEILVIDEVLAVGDMEFQRKCLGKMNEVAHSGRTVLFVSHNLAAVRQLCSRGILLKEGVVACATGIDECLDTYERVNRPLSASIWQREETKVNSALTIERVELEIQGRQPNHVLSVRIRSSTSAWHRPAFIALDITDSAGVPIMQPIPTIEGFILASTERHEIAVEVDLPPMIPGPYWVGVWVGSHYTETLDAVPSCVSFEIAASPTENRTFPHSAAHGYIVPTSRFLCLAD
jgi:homopolymeric O-antigen transport system ATP-binding protein